MAYKFISEAFHNEMYTEHVIGFDTSWSTTLSSMPER